MLSPNERVSFCKDVLDVQDDLLDNAIDWISSNLYPEDVFDQNSLESWALDNGFIKED